MLEASLGTSRDIELDYPEVQIEEVSLIPLHGSFKIISEGGTAAGVRRIVAATGHGALSFVRGLQHELSQAKVAGIDAYGKEIQQLLTLEMPIERAAWYECV